MVARLNHMPWAYELFHWHSKNLVCWVSTTKIWLEVCQTQILKLWGWAQDYTIKHYIFTVSTKLHRSLLMPLAQWHLLLPTCGAGHSFSFLLSVLSRRVSSCDFSQVSVYMAGMCAHDSLFMAEIALICLGLSKMRAWPRLSMNCPGCPGTGHS